MEKWGDRKEKREEKRDPAARPGWISCTPFERSMSCLSGGGFRGRCQRCAFEKAKRYREWAVERDGERRGGFSRDKGRGEEEEGGGRMEERKTAFLPTEFSVTLKSVFVPSDSHVPVEVHAPAGMQIANAPGVPKPILLFSLPLPLLLPRRRIRAYRLDSKMMDGFDGEEEFLRYFRAWILERVHL